MPSTAHYVIRGGSEGRERLRVLARIMHASTSRFLDELGLRDGHACLDVGCGGGDVTRELARRVAPTGRALGADLDETKIGLARDEASQQAVTNVEFHLGDVRELTGAADFDLVYARFLLTHLSDPGAAIATFQQRLRPGAILALEDVDFSGYFTYPESPAFRHFLELYCAAVHRRGGDPNIGARLPVLAKGAGLVDIHISVAQPIGTEGEVKLINPMTMENIADTVLADGLATRAEIDAVVRDMYEFAADPNTVSGVPRIVQVWGRRPG